MQKQIFTALLLVTTLFVTAQRPTMEPPNAAAPKAAEKDQYSTRQTPAHQDAPFPDFRSRLDKTLNVPRRGRLRLSLACGLVGCLFAQPVRPQSNPHLVTLGDEVGVPSTARVERAHSYRARSASRRTARHPSHPSEAARCASTGDSPGYPPFFSIRLGHELL